MPDESSVEHSTIDRKAGSSREKGLSSVFLTSLSGGVEGGSDKKQPHRKRKVRVCVCVCERERERERDASMWIKMITSP